MKAGLTAVSWLDWKLGARLLLKYPALTIIGGLSLAGAIALGAVGIEVADELLYKRLPFEEGEPVDSAQDADTDQFDADEDSDEMAEAREPWRPNASVLDNPEAFGYKVFSRNHDEEIAAELTRRGYRSPRELTVIPSTVRTIRLKYGLRRPRPGSKPRRIPGKLTVPQLIQVLDVPLHWVYQRIERGEIQISLDPERKLYLFPDTPDAIAKLKKLKTGQIQSVRL